MESPCPSSSLSSWEELVVEVFVEYVLYRACIALNNLARELDTRAKHAQILVIKNLAQLLFRFGVTVLEILHNSLACPCRGGPRSASGRLGAFRFFFKHAKTTLQRRRHEPEPRIDGESGFDT